VIYLWTQLALFAVIGAGLLAIEYVREALHRNATWLETYRSALWAGLFGSAAVTAVFGLVGMWTA
jgi:hypothetical protein